MDGNPRKIRKCVSVLSSRDSRAKKNVEKAFLVFLAAAKLNPAMKNSLKEIFNSYLVNFVNSAMDDRPWKYIDYCFLKAIECFPENDLIYCSHGDFLLNSESPELVVKAITCFRQCLSIDRWNLQAIRKLENSCNIAVERWHFRMLNDKIRNEAFRKAIIQKVKDGYRSVLDIGTGTGLLSLFAAEAGANEIYACDSSTAMTQMAKKSLHGKNVKVLTIHSTDLKIPKHLPNRVSLVVCEIMDAGLFGENVLETLTHAWEDLLEPSGTVIPQSASFHICGIASQYILGKHILINKPKNIELENFKIFSEEIVYDSENIASLPGGFTQLTETVCPLEVNFNNPDDIKKVLDGKKDILVTLRCTESGIMSCIAGWFSLKLTQDIVIDTRPNSGVKCWDQAIFPCPYVLKVVPNQQIQIVISFQNGLTQITFPEVQPTTTKLEIKLSQDAISMLNDEKYVNALEVTGKAIPKTSGPCRFLDTSPFPVMALNYFRYHKQKGTLVSTCVASGDQELIMHIAKCLGIDIVFTEHFLDNEVKSEIKFDVIFLSVVDATGEFNSFYLHQLPEIRNILKQDGLLFPQEIRVKGQLVESEWIRRASRVVNTDVTCNYDIASHINAFVVRHQLDFQLKFLNATKRSQPFELFSLDLLEESTLKEKSCYVTITEAGQVDALPFWFEMRFLTGNEFMSMSTDNSTHFNSAAILFDKQVSDIVHLVSKYENGLFMTEIE